jgi:hypothetical protein
MTMTAVITDVGRFDQKLDAMVSRGFVSTMQREFLEAALDAGNAASHRGHCPKTGELNMVMDIVESVICQIYVLPDVAARLKASTPPRKQP